MPGKVDVADKEALVFSTVRKGVQAAYPKARNFVSSVDAVPTEFPCVFIHMTDDYDVASMMTSFHDRDPQRITFQCDVYSQATSGRKAEVKKIQRLVAIQFKNLGFTRLTGSFEPKTLVDEKGTTVAWSASRFGAVWDPGSGQFCTF